VLIIIDIKVTIMALGE